MNRSRLARPIALLVVTCALAAGAYAIFWRNEATLRALTLYGNVDIREVQLAFHDTGRIERMFVQEGDTVHAGQLIAIIDQTRYKAAVENARGQVESQQQVLARLLAGSRPEEILQARANMDALEATLINAKINYRRIKALAETKVVPPQQLDDARRALDAARGNYEAAREAWILAVKGPRVEDIRAARDQLTALEGALALYKREFADTQLYAPSDGVIEDRILEPGDMASPNVPAFTIALTNPLWVRAYVPETWLGKIYLGMKAMVTTDSFPGKIYEGWVGYISPTAEFTPKSVETPELRTQLVYQVRVYVCNPENELRLGMPATVAIDLDQPKSNGPSEFPCASVPDVGQQH